VGGAGDEEHVGDDVVVVGRDGAACNVAEGDGVGATSEDLLVGAGGDEGLEEAREGNGGGFELGADSVGVVLVGVAAGRRGEGVELFLMSLFPGEDVLHQPPDGADDGEYKGHDGND
jgi:hypothetical protein